MENSVPRQEKYLVLKGVAGMGNRILALLQAFCYAQVSRRKLIVDWRDHLYASKGKNAFTELFSSPLVETAQQPSKEASIYPPIWEGKIDYTFNRFSSQFADLSVDDQLNTFSIDFSKIDYPQDILVMFEYCFHFHKLGEHRKELLSKGPFANERSLLKYFLKDQLFLKPSIQKRVDAFYEENLKGKEVIGVHIRSTDNQKHLSKNIDINKFSVFVNDILKKKPNAYIFLSTDNYQVARFNMQNYKNVICAQKFFPTEFGMPIHYSDRNVEESAVEALIDLYLLGKCDHLVFSERSSFGKVASILSQASDDNIYNVEDKNLLQKVSERQDPAFQGWRPFDGISTAILQYPKKLKGAFWGITTLYNPAGYDNKRENFRRFREASKKQGLKLLAVELGFGDNPFELTNQDADILIQRRVDTNNVLWQKEALLNVGLKHLPADCDKVAWLDCDILFKNENWISETSKLLEQYVVVQPFSQVVFLPHNESDIKNVENLPVGLEAGHKIHGMGYGVATSGGKVLNKFTEHGHSGLAWSARREVLDACGYYDRLIVGSGDLIISYAFYNNDNYSSSRVLNTDFLRKDRDLWSRSMNLQVKGSVYYTPGHILHLWHGDYQNRNYVVRDQILKNHQFDPAVDIRKNDQGIWVWASNKQQLHRDIKEYFFKRNESASTDLFLKLRIIKRYIYAKANSFRILLDQMYLNVLTFFGQSLRKLFPHLYSKLKKHFPDRTAGGK